MKGDKYVIPGDNLNNTAPSIGTFAGRGLVLSWWKKSVRLLAGTADQSNVRY
jgi:hypothetical protein